MQSEHLNEARRQIETCDACRYCEGNCSVFPGCSGVFLQAPFTKMVHGIYRLAALVKDAQS